METPHSALERFIHAVRVGETATALAMIDPDAGEAQALLEPWSRTIEAIGPDGGVIEHISTNGARKGYGPNDTVLFIRPGAPAPLGEQTMAWLAVMRRHADRWTVLSIDTGEPRGLMFTVPTT